MQDTLSTIAKLYTQVETLKLRHSDRLDFHSISVGSLKAALTAAYLAGYARGVRAANGSKQDALPTETHLMENGEWIAVGPADPTTWPNAEVVITAPIPEVALINDPATDDLACMVLIPNAVKQRRIG